MEEGSWKKDDGGLGSKVRKFYVMGMLRQEEVNADSSILNKVKSLYERAFPKSERIPMAYLLDKGKGRKFIAYYEGDSFCGFANYIANGGITNIIYFAVEDGFRNRGLGTEILKAIVESTPENTIVVDIEVELPQADNNEQRRRRKAFYQRNGFYESDIRYKWQGESYQLLLHGKPVTLTEFQAFWTRIIGKTWIEVE